MENKNWLVGLIALVIIVTVSIIGFSKLGNKNSAINDNRAVSGVVSESFFATDAKVMLFYSDQCSWCNKQKEVLARLAVEGYRVKPMDVGADQSLWEAYKINGTPTFVAENGDRLEGYQTDDKLKPWLDAHGSKQPAEQVNN